MGQKAAKGTVGVNVFRDRLRLTWSYLGKRYFLYIGLPDTRTNRVVAEGKARLIEGDMATGNFDLTLAKYRVASPESRLLATVLFKKFIAFKTKEVTPRTLQKYRAILKHLQEFFGDRIVHHVRVKDAEQFRDWLLEQIQPVTIRDRLTVLNACWNWAIEEGLASENPWCGVKVVVIRRQPKPFTEQEIRKIMTGFRTSRSFQYYADYVEFLFSTGVRTGEAIGLCWKHLDQDCRVVQVREQLTRGERKNTKNHKERVLRLSPNIQKMLLARRPDDWEPDDLVFPAPKGGAIDDHNFQRRVWAKILTMQGIEYRKPYNTRHTTLSHAIKRGVAPARVAEMAGDRLETIMRNYIGNPEGIPETLDFDWSL